MSESIRPKQAPSSSPKCRRCRRARHPSSYRVGLLCLLTPDRPPFEEAVHWYNAAALEVRIAERRQVPHSLALGVDRLAPTRWIHTPVGNKAPAQRVQRYLPGLMVTSDDQ